MGGYFFAFEWVFEVFDVLNDVVEFFLVVGFGRRVVVLVVGEGRVVEIVLLIGVHQILIVSVWVAHF
jgi:hypothetical protein